MKIKVFIAIMIIMISLVACGNRNSRKTDNNDLKGVATVDTPIISMSGKYQLKIIELDINGVKHNKFAITKISNGTPESAPIFTSSDVFRTRDTLYFVWDSNDRVWVYSGDVGTFFWERVSDSDWKKLTYADNKSVPVPDLLKKLKPNYFE